MIQNFVDEVNNSIDDSIRNMHTVFPGKIVTYNPGTNLATVEPVMKMRKPDGSMIPYPRITGVPVIFTQTYGQKATVATPIHPNDGCLILIAEQSIDYWMYGHETDTDLAFDITNAICIPGLFVPPNPVMQAACADNAIKLNLNGTQISIEDGEIIIDANHVQLNGKMDATGDITAELVSVAHHIHTGDSGGLTSEPHKTGTTQSMGRSVKSAGGSATSEPLRTAGVLLRASGSESNESGENIKGSGDDSNASGADKEEAPESVSGDAFCGYFVIYFDENGWEEDGGVYTFRKDLSGTSLTENAFISRIEQSDPRGYSNLICGYSFDTDEITLIYDTPVSGRVIIQDPRKQMTII